MRLELAIWVAEPVAAVKLLEPDEVHQATEAGRVWPPREASAKLSATSWVGAAASTVSETAGLVTEPAALLTTTS